MWIHRDLVLCGVTDETFCVRERHIRWGGPVTLVVGDDLNSIILPDADTTEMDEMSIEEYARSATGDLRVGGAQVDTDSFSGHCLQEWTSVGGGGECERDRVVEPGSEIRT